MNHQAVRRQSITAGTVVAGGTVHRPGRLDIADGSITAVGAATSRRPGPGADEHDLGEVIVVPGFVDMHVHGGGGGSFTSADPTLIDRAIAFHRTHGTTAMCASLVSASPATLREQVARLVPFVDRGDLVGIHLEGPWLAPERLGAHDPHTLRLPALEEIRELLHLARGSIRMVTLAPELPGAVAAIELLREHDVVAAVGHTDATYDRTRTAIDAGARVGTHLFNAMRPVGHREPGPVIALVEDPRVVVEVIADGVHVHPTMVDQVRRWVGADRMALVTDAMAAAGMPDGDYDLGTLAVTVTDGVARLADGGSIAGGTGTSGLLFRTATDPAHPLADGSLIQAVESTSATPARALGLRRRDLSPGTPADLVALSPTLQIAGVMCRGTWVESSYATMTS